jgi:hypothetical protein
MPKVDGIETKPCVGCGYCCRKGPCGLASKHDIWRPVENGGCKALKWDGAKWRCNLVTLDSGYAEQLYIGEGCCCGLFNEERQKIPTPEDISARRALAEMATPDSIDWRKILRAFTRGLAGSFVSGDAVYLAIRSMERNLSEDEYDAALTELISAYSQNTSKMADEFIGTDLHGLGG